MLSKIRERRRVLRDSKSKKSGRRIPWVRKLERLGWRIAMRHDLLAAKKVEGSAGKVGKLYDFLAPVYDIMFRRLEGFKGGGERLVERAVRPGERVLDMGTGTGIMLKPLFEVTDRVHGFDLHPKMLKGAKKWADKEGKEPHLLRGSAMDLPYRDESFDAVITAYMMVYLTEEQTLSCLLEVHRVLVQGGRLAILCGAGERSPRNPVRDQWLDWLYSTGFRNIEFDDFYDVLRIVTAER